MSTPDTETAPFLLLRTKFQRPRPQENLVSRPRLLDQLNEGLRPGSLSESDIQHNGHESLNTTRIYTQPSGRDLERAVQRAAGEIVNG